MKISDLCSKQRCNVFLWFIRTQEKTKIPTIYNNTKNKETKKKLKKNLGLLTSTLDQLNGKNMEEKLRKTFRKTPLQNEKNLDNPEKKREKKTKKEISTLIDRIICSI